MASHDILIKLAQSAAQRVARAQESVPLEDLKKQALLLPSTDFIFERALEKPGMSFICEIKKASPSKGVIAHDFPYMDIAREYAQAGADCISVLTEPTQFLGSLNYLDEISHEVDVPCLRKDFIVHEYMIYEAKIAGASAVLLICSILTPEQLKAYINLAHELGMSALVEVHDKDEAQMACDAGARIVGVNNRNLRDFTVDTTNSARIRSAVPDDILFVSESGISNPEEVALLETLGVDAVLVGEYLMRATNKQEALEHLRGEL
ncbi:MAG: indole-3-glycerol phosphate synthase TrpC [Eggerthellaceae bacterium]|nr:indole-3-glycerol phosphate synthase TrpC [Eggerthellaceae bacterium]